MQGTPLFLGRLIVMFLITAISFALVDGNAAGWVLLIGVVITVANYLVGDLSTLPRFGSVVTSLAEGTLAVFGVFVLSLIFTPIHVSPTGLAVFGVLVGAGEFLFHKYLRGTDAVVS